MLIHRKILQHLKTLKTTRSIDHVYVSKLFPSSMRFGTEICSKRNNPLARKNLTKSTEALKVGLTCTWSALESNINFVCLVSLKIIRIYITSEFA